MLTAVSRRKLATAVVHGRKIHVGFRAPVLTAVDEQTKCRFASSSSSSTTDTFRPRRMSKFGEDRIRSRAEKPRGPIDPNGFDPKAEKEPRLLGSYDDDDDDDDDNMFNIDDEINIDDSEDITNEYKMWKELDFDDDLTDKTIGPSAAGALRHTLMERARSDFDEGLDQVESQLRDADYFISDPGSTEDLVGARRSMMGMDKEERAEFNATLDKLIEDAHVESLDLGNDDLDERDDDHMDQDEEEHELVKNYDIKPWHNWAETIVRVDRVQKVQRGGTMVRYRCLVVGGNTKGVAGFGIGKAGGPKEASELASRLCKKNIFFCDRYLGSGITSDLVGKHNSCKVLLRTVRPGHGLRGHDLVKEILVSFGITDCSAKTHGNRNIYNVVRATFKAILRHESIEDVAMKRGKRLLNLERARRLDIG